MTTTIIPSTQGLRWPNGARCLGCGKRSRLTHRGASPVGVQRQVSEWLGHADPSFTLSTYMHW